MEPQKTTKDYPELVWLDRMSGVLDDRFRFPGTNIRFGLDFLMGLVPGAGDILGFGVSGFLILVMVRRGASGMVVLKMIWNIFIDALLGVVPLAGNIFDLVFRANRRNLRLLMEHYREDRHQGSAWWVLWLVLGVLAGLVFLLIYLSVRLLSWIF